MISFSVVFVVLIFVFALIGALRCWSKELLAMFSIILALAAIQLLQTYVPPVSRLLASGNPRTQFFFWSAVVILFAVSGYHVPGIYNKLATPHKRLQDRLLGFILGACNGYLLVGTIWHYLDTAGYPFAAEHMTAPGEAAQRIITLLPPALLTVPKIYFVLVIACTVMVVVFI